MQRVTTRCGQITVIRFPVRASSTLDVRVQGKASFSVCIPSHGLVKVKSKRSENKESRVRKKWCRGFGASRSRFSWAGLATTESIVGDRELVEAAWGMAGLGGCKAGHRLEVMQSPSQPRDTRDSTHPRSANYITNLCFRLLSFAAAPPKIAGRDPVGETLTRLRRLQHQRCEECQACQAPKVRLRGARAIWGLEKNSPHSYERVPFRSAKLIVRLLY